MITARVRKRDGRRVYEVRLRDPQGREYSRTFETKKAAQDFEAEDRIARRRGSWVDPRHGDLTFEEVARRWLQANPAKRPSARAADESTLRAHLLPAFGAYRIASVTPPDIQGFVTELSRSAAPTSVRRWYSTLHAVFAYAVASDWLGRSPCRGINLPAATTTRSRRLTAEEIGSIAAAHRDSFYIPWIVRYLEAVVADEPSPTKALAMSFGTTEDRATGILLEASRRQLLPAATGDWSKDKIVEYSRRLLAGRDANTSVSEHEAMVWVGAVLGLRWSEVAGLRIGSVDLLRRTLTVAPDGAVTRDGKGRPVIGNPKSVAGARTIAIPASLVDVLARHLAARGVTAADLDRLLFEAPKGGPLRYSNWLRRVWRPATAAAGCETAGFHDLRRANATAMVVGGVDVKTAQSRLGHSDPRITLAIYAQVVEEADRRAAETVGETFLGSWNRDTLAVPVAETAQQPREIGPAATRPRSRNRNGRSPRL
jgi:integrase